MPSASAPTITRLTSDGKGGLYMIIGSHLCHYCPPPADIREDQVDVEKDVMPSIVFTSENGIPLSSAMAISPKGDMVAIVDMAKNVTILNRAQDGTIVLRGILEKGAMCATFSSEETLLIGDKFGDIVQFSLAAKLNGGAKSPSLEPPVKGTIIAGCVSMVTDLAICGGRNAILMADRDEKVRLIRRDKPWIIDGFCLEHTEYVAGIGIIEASPLWMVSLGGDARLILWDLHDQPRSEQILRVGEDKGEDGTEFTPFCLCMSTSSLSFFTRGDKDNSTIYTFDIDCSGTTPRILESPRMVDLNEPVMALAYCNHDTLIMATEHGRLLTLPKGQDEAKELISLESFVSSLSPTSGAHPGFDPLEMAATLRKRRYQFESATKRRRQTQSRGQPGQDDGDDGESDCATPTIP